MIKNEIIEKLKVDSEFLELTNAELAKKYNCSRVTINRAIRSAGLKKQRIKLRSIKYTPKSKKELYISEELHEIIVGSLLGDGYITPNLISLSRNKARNKNSSLIIKHGNKQKEYCLYKKQLLEKHIKCYFREMVRTDFRFAIPEYIQYAVETVPLLTGLLFRFLSSVIQPQCDHPNARLIGAVNHHIRFFVKTKYFAVDRALGQVGFFDI